MRYKWGILSYLRGILRYQSIYEDTEDKIVIKDIKRVPQAELFFLKLISVFLQNKVVKI